MSCMTDFYCGAFELLERACHIASTRWCWSLMAMLWQSRNNIVEHFLKAMIVCLEQSCVSLVEQMLFCCRLGL